MMEIRAHQVLYKFFSIDTEEQVKRVQNALQFGELYFASPASFNDPFDCKPVIEGVGTHRKQLAQIRRIGQEQGIDLPRSHRRKIRNNLRGETLNLLSKGAQWTSDFSLDQQGVLCLAGNREHPLMWSHYANGHTGVCIGFKTSGSPLALAKPVSYDRERAKHEFGSKDWEGVFNRAFGYKAPYWKYEDEHRLVALSRPYAQRLKDAEKIPEVADFLLNRNGPGTYRFGSQQVTSLAFGIKADPILRRCLAEFARAKVPGIEVVQAQPSPNDYTISFSSRLV